MKILCIGSRLFDDVAPYFREKGIESVVTESNPDADNLDLADEVFIGPRGMKFPRDVAIKEKVDGIVPLIGIDPPLLDVAYMKEEVEAENNIPVVASNVHAVQISSDKSKTKEIFRKIGVNTPESVYVYKEGLDDFEDIIHKEGFDFPVVLKQNQGQGGKDISIVSDLDGVRKYFETFDGALCENFIEGAEISIETLGWKGEYLPLVPVYKGDTGINATHPITRVRYGPTNFEKLDNEEIRATALKIAQNIRTEGNLDLDFIYDRKNNKLYAIEANTRPSGTRYLTQASSTINTLAELVDMAAGVFSIGDVESRIRNYYCAEIPVGTYEGEIPEKTFKEKDYVVHGPVGYQRVTIRASSKDELISKVKDITGRDIEI